MIYILQKLFILVFFVCILGSMDMTDGESNISTEEVKENDMRER